jgi:hypothetical protein
MLNHISGFTSKVSPIGAVQQNHHYFFFLLCIGLFGILLLKSLLEATPSEAEVLAAANAEVVAEANRIIQIINASLVDDATPSALEAAVDELRTLADVNSDPEHPEHRKAVRVSAWVLGSTTVKRKILTGKNAELAEQVLRIFANAFASPDHPGIYLAGTMVNKVFQSERFHELLRGEGTPQSQVLMLEIVLVALDYSGEEIRFAAVRLTEKLVNNVELMNIANDSSGKPKAARIAKAILRKIADNDEHSAQERAITQLELIADAEAAQCATIMVPPEK